MLHSDESRVNDRVYKPQKGILRKQRKVLVLPFTKSTSNLLCYCSINIGNDNFIVVVPHVNSCRAQGSSLKQQQYENCDQKLVPNKKKQSHHYLRKIWFLKRVDKG